MRSKVCKAWQALRMADTSAWAVGSLLSVTRFTPVATISPSFTITAPKGPPPLATFWMDRAMAWRINCLSASSPFSIVSVDALGLSAGG